MSFCILWKVLRTVIYCLLALQRNRIPHVHSLCDAFCISHIKFLLGTLHNDHCPFWGFTISRFAVSRYLCLSRMQILTLWGVLYPLLWWLVRVFLFSRKIIPLLIWWKNQKPSVCWYSRSDSEQQDADSRKEIDGNSRGNQRWPPENTRRK